MNTELIPMSFDHMIELHWIVGYRFAWCFGGGAVAGPLRFFKPSGWF